MTRNFSPLSLKPVWNCVRIRLQNPRCQSRGGWLRSSEASAWPAGSSAVSEASVTGFDFLSPMLSERKTSLDSLGTPCGLRSEDLSYICLALTRSSLAHHEFRLA